MNKLHSAVNMNRAKYQMRYGVLKDAGQDILEEQQYDIRDIWDRRENGSKSHKKGGFSTGEQKGGKVKLKLPQFFQMLRNYKEKAELAQYCDQIPSSNYLVRSLSILGQEASLMKKSGNKESDSIYFDSNKHSEHETVTNLNNQCVNFLLEYEIDILESQDDLFEMLKNVSDGDEIAGGISQEELEEYDDLKEWNWCVLLRRVQGNIVLNGFKVVQKDSKSKDTKLDSNTFNDVTQEQQDESGLRCVVGKLGDQCVLLCNKHGSYRILLDVTVSLKKSKNTVTSSQLDKSLKKVKLHIPKAVKNHLSFFIESDEVQVKVSPSLSVKKSILNNSKHESVSSTEAKETDDIISEDSFMREISGEYKKKITHVDCIFTSTTKLSIQWAKTQPVIHPLTSMSLSEKHDIEETQDKSDEEEEEDLIPISTTVEQFTMHSIGEGLCKSTCKFKYLISNGSTNTLQLEINTYERPFKILGITGVPIKEWKMQDTNGSKKLLTITLHYPVQNNVELYIKTELEMIGTTCILDCPVLQCYGNVEREHGQIAVVAFTNIEIKENEKKYISTIDASDMNNSLKALLLKPAVYVYKYFEQGYNIKLDITRHDDVSVLGSCINKCAYTCTYTENSWLHSIKMEICNTSKQFLRIKMDSNAEIWTTKFADKPVKPVSEKKDQYKLILIPMKDHKNGKPVQIEIVLKTSASSIKSSGSISSQLVSFDLPILEYGLVLDLPNDFEYSEFQGNIEEEYKSHYCKMVFNSFGSSSQENNLLQSRTKPRPPKKKAIARARQQMSNIQEVMNESLDKVINRGECLEEIENQAMSLGRSSSAFKSTSLGGVIPMSLKFERNTSKSTSFEFFSSFLCEDEQIQLKVSFKKLSKSSLARRNANSKPWYIPTLTRALFALILLSIISLLVYFYGGFKENSVFSFVNDVIFPTKNE